LRLDSIISNQARRLTRRKPAGIVAAEGIPIPPLCLHTPDTKEARATTQALQGRQADGTGFGVAREPQVVALAWRS
jgi:hypothetical protein